jgi:hypothetical protein
MTQPSSRRPLQPGPGLRILNARLFLRTGEIEEYSFRQAAMTVLVGARNTSKTTTLKVINYCLGDHRSVAQSIGSAIDEKYTAFAIEIGINGVRHILRRDSSYGNRGRVQIDNDITLDADDLSAWLLGQLGWPQLTIPLGINPSTATSLVSLSFRSCLRHIYRREDSWTEFAYKEEEYLRRAVISLFLGFAPARYETADYEIGRARHRLSSADAVYRDVLASTSEAVGALTTQLNIPLVLDADSLMDVEIELRHRLEAAQSERDSLTETAAQAVGSSAESPPGFDPLLPGKLQMASAEAAAAAQLVASLERLIGEHGQSRYFVRADILRLGRLIDASDAFEAIPVTLCPACEQSIDSARRHDNGECYLCSQPVSGDLARRRAEREQRALEAELDDIDDALRRAESDLQKAQQDERSSAELREQISRRLHDDRAARLTPFMAALEDVATEIGRIKQQIAALPALETILARRTAANDEVTAAASEVERLEELAAEDARTTVTETRRCGLFADKMNEFLEGNKPAEWREGGVAVAAETLSFYVSTRPWSDNLGAEARVLFFLSYCYALISLDETFGQGVCAPGVLLLDNPYQQGLRQSIVLESLNRLAWAANSRGAQIILTQPRTMNRVSAPHAEISMLNVYES